MDGTYRIVIRSGPEGCTVTYRLAALIKQAVHARSNRTVLVEGVVLDHTPEVEETQVVTANRRVTTHIGSGLG